MKTTLIILATILLLGSCGISRRNTVDINEISVDINEVFLDTLRMNVLILDEDTLSGTIMLGQNKYTELFNEADSSFLTLGDVTYIPADTFIIAEVYVDSTTCEERGHVCTGPFMETAMHCPSYIVDHENYSEEVFPACNTRTYTCERCGEYIHEPGKERRVVIWERNKISLKSLNSKQ